MSEVLQMSSSKFYRTNKFTDRQKRSELETGPPTKKGSGLLGINIPVICNCLVGFPLVVLFKSVILFHQLDSVTALSWGL